MRVSSPASCAMAGEQSALAVASAVTRRTHLMAGIVVLREYLSRQLSATGRLAAFRVGSLAGHPEPGRVALSATEYSAVPGPDRSGRAPQKAGCDHRADESDGGSGGCAEDEAAAQP